MRSIAVFALLFLVGCSTLRQQKQAREWERQFREVVTVEVNYAATADDGVLSPVIGENEALIRLLDRPNGKRAAIGCVPVRWKREHTTSEIIARLDRRGLRPATFRELLAFSRANPDAQRTREIVALGSSHVLRGGRTQYAYLDWYNGRGVIYTYAPIDDSWETSWWFLAVRKE